MKVFKDTAETNIGKSAAKPATNPSAWLKSALGLAALFGLSKSADPTKSQQALESDFKYYKQNAEKKILTAKQSNRTV